MTHTKLSLVIIAAATLLSLSSFGASKIVRAIEQSINLDGVAKIEVRVQGGFINLSGDQRSDAHVLIEKVFRNASEKEADSIESKIEQIIEVRDDVLYIEFKYDNDWDFWSLFKSKPSVNFNATLSVPESIDVDLHTSGGHIEIDGVEGDVAARTSGGHMNLANIGGPVNAHTSGGSITASDLRSAADLSTSGGRIKVDSIAGNSKLKTSGGSISATGVNGPLDAKTSGGSITATFPRGIDADTVLKTSGGGITAKLPQSERFYLNARTSGGGVRTDFPITMTGELKRSQTAEGPVNGGGPLLELRTSGGSINVGYLKDQT